MLLGSGMSESGVSVTPSTALQVPAIWGAVNFLSGTIASLPLHVYQRNGDDREQVKDSILYKRLHRAPNPQWTSYAWRRYMMQRVLLGGRGLTYIDTRTLTLWPLETSKVRVVRENGNVRYKHDESGRTYTPDQIIDIPFMLDEDQLSHVSPVDKLKDVIGLSIALQDYAARHFRNGGMPPAVLQGPAMSPAAAKRAGNDVKKAISDAVKTGGIPVLPEGYEIKELGVSPRESQMEDSRRFQLEEAARVYSLPPVFLQDLTRATYSNTEQQDLHLVKHTLTQWLAQIEQEINLKLFKNRPDMFAEFNVDGLLRGDFATRMTGYATAVQNALKTPNEIRAKENDPPMEGGDQLHLQQNMSELSALGGQGNDDQD